MHDGIFCKVEVSVQSKDICQQRKCYLIHFLFWFAIGAVFYLRMNEWRWNISNLLYLLTFKLQSWIGIAKKLVWLPQFFFDLPPSEDHDYAIAWWTESQLWLLATGKRQLGNILVVTFLVSGRREMPLISAIGYLLSWRWSQLWHQVKSPDLPFSSQRKRGLAPLPELLLQYKSVHVLGAFVLFSCKVVFSNSYQAGEIVILQEQMRCRMKWRTIMSKPKS